MCASEFAPANYSSADTTRVRSSQRSLLPLSSGSTRQTASSQPPLPQAKPPQLVSAKPAAPAADLVALKPGTVLTVDGRATVIPRLRP